MTPSQTAHPPEGEMSHALKLAEALERISELDKFGGYNSACEIARKAVAAWNTRPDVRPQGEEGLWRPQIGECVTIAPTAEFAEDWRGVRLWVAGINHYGRRPDAPIEYSVSEHWPPRHPGDITTDFLLEQLAPATISNQGKPSS